jgi:DnaJ-domain-containing protein 1
MSLTRRILEGARSGLSQLTSLVIVDDEPLSQVDAAALEAELKSRRAGREARPRKPEDNPIARLAGASAEARAARTKQANERAAKIHQERSAREAQQKASADEAFRRMKAQAAAGGGYTPPSSGSTGSSSRPPRPGSPDALAIEWYRTLDLQPGADMAQVKSAYRTMMRKYHPDLHANDARKQKAATELSTRVTTAYNGLRQHLGEK